MWRLVKRRRGWPAIGVVDSAGWLGGAVFMVGWVITVMVINAL